MAVYEIPLVPSNLRPQEMITQMADTLEFLDQVSSDIFSKVTLKIQESRSRINKIHKRVEVAQAKIDGLKGSRKATKIFSSSRFPGNFKADDTSIFHEASLKFTKTPVVPNGSEVVVDGDLIFYPTHQLNRIKHQTPALPSSVSELLIFNTEDLAFQEQSIADKSSKSTLRRKHDSEMSVDTSLGDAPWSISQREQLERSNPLNFSYMPGIYNWFMSTIALNYLSVPFSQVLEMFRNWIYLWLFPTYLALLMTWLITKTSVPESHLRW